MQAGVPPAWPAPRQAPGPVPTGQVAVMCNQASSDKPTARRESCADPGLGAQAAAVLPQRSDARTLVLCGLVDNHRVG
jgi:hypothetical protein